MIFKQFTALDEALLKKLCEVYCDCFRGPPWNEPEWTNQAARGILDSHLIKGGDLFLVTDQPESEVFGFGLGLPLKDFDPELTKFMIPLQSYWFSDVGTKADWRNKGFASEMIRLRQAAAKKRGFSELSTRTLPNCTQHRLLKSHGFRDHCEASFDTGGKSSKRVLMLKDI